MVGLIWCGCTADHRQKLEINEGVNGMVDRCKDGMTEVE